MPAQGPRGRESAEQILAALQPVVEGIQRTFGRTCEVVLHDYRSPDHSVRAVAGEVTGRTVGSPASEIGLRMIELGDAASDELNYAARLADGREIKSSTILIRDGSSHVVGALCINVDMSPWQLARELVDSIGTSSQAGDSQLPGYNSDPESIITAALTDAARALGQPLHRLNAAERCELVERLDRLGIFRLKGSMPIVAARLGVSRATGYNYLARTRSESGNTQTPPRGGTTRSPTNRPSSSSR